MAWPAGAQQTGRDPIFPTPEEILILSGRDPGQFRVDVSWTERVWDGSGRFVRGIHVIAGDGSGEFDLYCDEFGNVLTDAMLSAFGIKSKYWQTPPKSQPGHAQRLRPKRAPPEAKPMTPGTPAIMPERVMLAPVDNEALVSADAQDAARGAKTPLQIGIGRQLPEPVAVESQSATHGRWEHLPDGSRVWSLTITSPNAVGQRVHFVECNVPPGARLILYNANNPSEAYGPFPKPYEGTRDLWSPTCFSESVTVECYVPAGVNARDLFLVIDTIIHQYREIGPQGPESAPKAPAGPCNLDVTCHPDWAEQSLGVAGFTKVGRSPNEIFCTLSLLADADNTTEVPFLLAAAHCISTQFEANSIQVFWFYQTDTCNGIPPSILDVPRTTGGADLLVTSPFNGGTDVTLMRLREAPPPEAVFLGWSSQPQPVGEPTATIGHPRGDFKRIAFGTVTANVDLCISSSISLARFYQSTWSQGTTEPASSGSPLFNEEQLVIGQLWGGGASCSQPLCPDYYGRFDVSYFLLRPFIDPEPPPPMFDFVKPSYLVNEFERKVTVTVRLSRPLPEGQLGSVILTTQDGTATAGSDYFFGRTILLFPTGVLERSYDIFLRDDFEIEGLEHFFVRLSNAAGAPLGTDNNPATVFIRDNEPDTDGDLLSDADEANGFFGFVTDPARRDTDWDTLSDMNEIFGTFGIVTNPLLWDMDGDGFSDGIEVSFGYDPTDPNSHPPSVPAFRVPFFRPR